MEAEVCDRATAEKPDRVTGRYSLRELAEIAEISPRRVRSWIRAGLIEPPDDAEPNYGFDDVRLVSLLAKLSESGFSTARLRGVLSQLRRRFPNPHEALAQLDLFAGILVIRDADSRLTAPDGQMLFDLAGRSDAASTIAMRPKAASADDLFERAVSLEQSGDLERAALAYREILRQEGPDPGTCFNLANVLAASGHAEAAVERYRQALELDPENAPIWNNLGLTLADRGESEEALEAWQRAIEVDPDYAEAIFNLADALEDAGRTADSRPLWKAYLRLDDQSEWGMYARRCLDFEKIVCPAERLVPKLPLGNALPRSSASPNGQGSRASEEARRSRASSRGHAQSSRFGSRRQKLPDAGSEGFSHRLRTIDVVPVKLFDSNRFPVLKRGPSHKLSVA